MKRLYYNIKFIINLFKKLRTTHSLTQINHLVYSDWKLKCGL